MPSPWMSQVAHSVPFDNEDTNFESDNVFDVIIELENIVISDRMISIEMKQCDNLDCIVDAAVLINSERGYLTLKECS